MPVFGVILGHVFPAFSRIWTEYVFNPNSGKCGKNTDQSNSEYGHFLRSFKPIYAVLSPVNILQNFSKVSERCTKDQWHENFNIILSKQQFGFLQGSITQHCILVMIEKWQNCLDTDGVNGALLTDLSKAILTVCHMIF